MAKNYLNRHEMFEEIMISKKEDKLTRNAEKMLILLADRTIKKFRYFNPTDGDDCYQYAVMVMLTNWRNFNPEKSDNPFAYFTEIFKRGCSFQLAAIHSLRGDKHKEYKVLSIHSSNEGDGMFSL